MKPRFLPKALHGALDSIMDNQKTRKILEDSGKELPKEWQFAIDVASRNLKEAVDNAITNSIANCDKQPEVQPENDVVINVAPVTFAWAGADDTLKVNPDDFLTVPNDADWGAINTDGNWGGMTIATPHPIAAITVFGPTDGDLIVEIKRTGEVTLGKNVSAEYAAHEFWKCLAKLGDQFEERLEELQDEVDTLEQGFDDEQSMRLELEETFNELCLALGVPSGEEDHAVDFAKKFKEEYDNGAKLIRELRGEDKPVEVIETAETAYKRAMKVVR